MVTGAFVAWCVQSCSRDIHAMCDSSISMSRVMMLFLLLTCFVTAYRKQMITSFCNHYNLMLSIRKHGNYLQESCFCVFRRRLFVVLGDSEKQMSKSLVQTYTQFHLSLLHLLMPFFSSSDSWTSMWKNCYTFYIEKSTESNWVFKMCLFNLQ